MTIIDANIVLRYLLNDEEDLYENAAEILENNEVFIPNEVIAEIIYVLNKVCKVDNHKISSILMDLFSYDNLQVNDIDIVNAALKLYAERRFDFVDTLLYAYNKVRKHDVYTFNKKLNKLINS